MARYAGALACYALLVVMVWRYRRTSTGAAAVPLASSITATPRGLLEGEPVARGSLALFLCLGALAIAFSVSEVTWVRRTSRLARLTFAIVWLGVTTALLAVVADRSLSGYRLVVLVVLHALGVLLTARHGLLDDRGGAPVDTLA